MGYFEWIAAAIAFSGVYLSTRGFIASWPLGIAGSMLYTWVFFKSSLPAEAVLQFLYVIMGIYGWRQWLVMGSRPNDRKISRINRAIFMRSLGAWFILSIVAGRLIELSGLGNLPYIDSALAAGGLVSTVLLAKKYLENWIFWIFIDLATAALFYSREMFASALLYLAFTAIAIKGYFEWRKLCEA
jgi:nicotinamide mononucleotide transporter